MTEIRPDWWTHASCRGDGADRWVVAKGETVKFRRLREVCSACPVAGRCLQDACEEPALQRAFGPVRCGLSGAKPWTLMRNLVDALEPQTDDDWSVLAAWVLDDRAERQLAAS